MDTTKKALNKIITDNLYTRYRNILSLSYISLFLIDPSGEILFEFIPAPDFCSRVCQENVNRVCNDYKKNFNCVSTTRFNCKYGLENILVPIILNEETVGYIGGLQVFTVENEYQKCMIDVHSFSEEKFPSLEYVAKSISSLKTVEENKIKIHEQLCEQIAKNTVLDLTEFINNTYTDVERLSIEKEILEKKIIDLEAKNMSLVINPHFLFNTLNCIARIAYFENSHTTEELIYCLSDLLRYNLRQDHQLHTIGAEIDNIEKYLYIQKVRFKNRLEYKIDIPENLKTFKIPNMIIQPILENAVIHGITPKRDGGKINISAKELNKDIIISISDNGNGFPKNKSLTGIGFKSTDSRLKQHYGEEYGLKITKSDFSGSTVTITIPTQPITR